MTAMGPPATKFQVEVQAEVQDLEEEDVLRLHHDLSLNLNLGLPDDHSVFHGKFVLKLLVPR
jgi:hypothetical protein